MNKGKEGRVEINESNPRVIVGTYGTLRLNQRNWGWILKGNSEFLGTYKTEPIFTMSGKGHGFPIVYTEGNTPITIDLFAITDKNTLEACHSLEQSTGIVGDKNGWYKLIKLHNEEHGDFYMYVQHGEADDVIESGNWLNQ